MTIGAHIIVIFATNVFLSTSGHYDNVKWVLLVSSALPLAIEFISKTYSDFNYRN